MADPHVEVWDYRLEQDIDQETLSALGAEGWELVLFAPGRGYAFKRPQPSFRDRVTLDQKARYYRLWANGRETDS